MVDGDWRKAGPNRSKYRSTVHRSRFTRSCLFTEGSEHFGETEGGFDCGLVFEYFLGDFTDGHDLGIDGVEFGDGFYIVANRAGFEGFLFDIGGFYAFGGDDQVIEQGGSDAFGDDLGFEFIGQVLTKLHQEIDQGFLVVIVGPAIMGIEAEMIAQFGVARFVEVNL